MAITLQQFIAQLDESGVLSSEEIVVFQERQTNSAETTEEFARELVQHKKLTTFQAEMLCLNKGEQLLLNDYLILDKIGAGGMGQVYLAEHRRMERDVALKTLPSEMIKNEQSIMRFQREVKAAAKLSHPNIVAAYDAGESKGIHYFVMEYVAGVNLASHVKPQGRLPVELAVNYILQAATGLEYAHSQGVIHRDIKPSNILLSSEGTIKILDMGLARIDSKMDEKTQTHLTETGDVMGTVDYMSPEQARDSHTADHRSDIYSLGCTLYYLLTGDSVYGGETVVNRILAHRDKPIPSLSSRHTHIPKNLDAIFQKMVAKNPEERYQRMGEVIHAIQSCDFHTSTSTTPTIKTTITDSTFDAQQIGTIPTVIVTEEKPQVETQHETIPSGILDETLLGSLTDRQQSKHHNVTRRRWWFATGILLIALLLAAGFSMLGKRSESTTSTILLKFNQPEIAGAIVSVDDQQKMIIKTGYETGQIEVMTDQKSHSLKVTKDGYQTFVKQFSAKGGEQQTITVQLKMVVVTKKKR